MIIYRGGPDPHTVTRDGKPLYPGPSLELLNASPTGFSWGCGGSGPAQLALALLYDATRDAELSAILHQRFKWDVVAKWSTPCWEITSEQIKDWVRLHRPSPVTC